MPFWLNNTMEESNVDPTEVGVERRTLLLEMASDEAKNLEARFAIDPECADHKLLLGGLVSAGRSVVGQPPVVAQRQLKLTRNPTISFSQIADIIRSDPSLTQGILRLANSAAYTSSGLRSSTVTMAVQRIGTKGVESVILGQFVEGLLCRPGGQYDEMVGQAWEHMIRVAPLAMIFAPAFGVQPEEAYTLGILHDVGKLVFFDHMTSQRMKLQRTLNVSASLVTASLHNLHELLGGLACAEWGLDARIVDAISTHHGPERGLVVSPEAQVIYLADRLDHETQGGKLPDLEAIWEGAPLTGSRDAAIEIFAGLQGNDTENVAAS